MHAHTQFITIASKILPSHWLVLLNHDISTRTCHSTIYGHNLTSRVLDTSFHQQERCISLAQLFSHEKVLPQWLCNYPLNDIHLWCWKNDVSSTLEVRLWPFMVLWHVLVLVSWLSKTSQWDSRILLAIVIGCACACTVIKFCFRCWISFQSQKELSPLLAIQAACKALYDRRREWYLNETERQWSWMSHRLSQRISGRCSSFVSMHGKQFCMVNRFYWCME